MRASSWNTFTVAASLLLAVATAPAYGARSRAPAHAAATARALDPANIDTTCSPCRDFFQYATGGWRMRTQIPAAFSTWGSFSELAERNRERLHSVLEAARAGRAAKPGSDVARLGSYYGACMDSTQAEVEGLKPVQPLVSAADDLQ